jgi:hypothetical protein
MTEPTLTEAVETDLSSSKTNRRKRLALRFVGPVVAVSVLGAAYWFMRSPELVWWRSPAVDITGRKVRMLIPEGWKPTFARIKMDGKSDFENGARFHFEPSAGPRWMKWLARPKERQAILVIVTGATREPAPRNIEMPAEREQDSAFWPDGRCIAQRSRWSADRRAGVEVDYNRTNRSAFNRTYRQICNSLTLE